MGEQSARAVQAASVVNAVHAGGGATQTLVVWSQIWLAEQSSSRWQTQPPPLHG